MNAEKSEPLSAEEITGLRWAQIYAPHLFNSDIRHRADRLLSIAEHYASLVEESERLREALQRIADHHVPDQPMALDIDEADYIRRCHTDVRRIAFAALALVGQRSNLGDYDE